MKNQKYDFLYSSSAVNPTKATLGSIDNILKKYFPIQAHDGFNGDIMELNW